MNSIAPGLYVVATPIGNLADLSPRASAILAEAAIVAAEDTRVSGGLVRRAGGSGRLVSLTEHNVITRAPELLEAATKSCVALVSDAGTPVISDPGARLVDAAHEAAIAVFAIPGASALAAAVSVSGFPGDDVHFLGFLPRQRGERRTRLQAAAATAGVLVFFESPGRLSATLNDLAEALDDPRVTVCRELTKVFEEVVRGRAGALAPRFASAKGECTVVVESPVRPNDDFEVVRQYMREMHRAGARRSAAATEAATRFKVARSAAYEEWPDGSE